MNIKPRPDLSEFHSAIDGIAKPNRNHRTVGGCMGDYLAFEQAELAIRPDVAKILNMSDHDFYVWSSTREKAISQQLEQYRLIASVPTLYNGSTPGTFEGHTAIKSLIEILEQAKENVELIVSRRHEAKWG